MTSFPKKVFLIYILGVIFADQATKAWILHYSQTSPLPLNLGEILDIVLVWNRGISWGWFNNGGLYNPLVFSAFSLIISAVLGVLLWKAHSRMTATALSFIIGGALGNLIDRLRFGGVVDFIYFHWNSWGFPAFNVADAAITLGVIVMIGEEVIAGLTKKDITT